MTTPAPENWKENFDQFLLGKYENGIQVPRTREEWIGFISNLLTAERERDRAELVEKIIKLP